MRPNTELGLFANRTGGRVLPGDPVYIDRKPYVVLAYTPERVYAAMTSSAGIPSMHSEDFPHWKCGTFTRTVRV